MRVRRLTSALLLVGAAGMGMGCSRGGDLSEVSVFALSERDCVTAMQRVDKQVNTVHRVPCTEEHTMEVFKVVPYPDPSGERAFPGTVPLTRFAENACGKAFEPYVGERFKESRFYYTYLLPTVTSWTAGAKKSGSSAGPADTKRGQSVICFVTTTGERLKRSVRGAGI